MAGQHVIVVDDEPDLRDSIASYLRINGFEVSEAANGLALDDLLGRRAADAILLDVNMPGEDGFSIARRLRDTSPAAIIMLTARADLIDRVVGLELGADDYISKPFELREVLARVRAVLRRAAVAPGAADVQDTKFHEDLWVPERGEMIRVPVRQIDLIRADRDYVSVQTATRAYLLRQTMDSLETVLDPAELVRVHRSAFVRLSKVAGFRRTARGGSLLLPDGSVVAVGPRYLGTVLKLLKADRL